MKRRVIVLEDDESLRLVITKALSRAGFEVRATASPDTAIDRMARKEADALVADVLLGRENFLERLSEVTQLRPDAPVIIMSAQTTVATALDANRGGAFEYLPKPFDINVLTETVERALHGKTQVRAKASVADNAGLVGQSSAMQATFKAIGKLAQSRVPVLIVGPDGVGRASTARLIHRQADNGGPLVEAGPQAFDAASDALWAQAAGGTLLLRRIEAWSDKAQAFVREALEMETPSSPRVMTTASPRVGELLPMALLDLLAVGRIEVPPLFQRGHDRSLLFETFLKAADSQYQLGKAGAEFVDSQAWPGEVLQLKRTAEHIAAQGHPGEVTPDAIKAAMSGPQDHDPDEVLERAGIRYFAASEIADSEGLAARAQIQLERGLIKAALEASGGVRQEAARRLGMNRNTFARKLDQYGLDGAD